MRSCDLIPNPLNLCCHTERSVSSDGLWNCLSLKSQTVRKYLNKLLFVSSSFIFYISILSLTSFFTVLWVMESFTRSFDQTFFILISSREELVLEVWFFFTEETETRQVLKQKWVMRGRANAEWRKIVYLPATAVISVVVLGLKLRLHEWCLLN